MGKEGEVGASSAHLSRERVSCDEKQRRTERHKDRGQGWGPLLNSELGSTTHSVC